MDYRVLTVSREFGSGGGRIAATIANRLGWKLLDRELIEAIACAGRVDAKVVRGFDEHVESWLSRMNRQAMRGAAMAAGVALAQNDSHFYIVPPLGPVRSVYLLDPIHHTDWPPHV